MLNKNFVQRVISAVFILLFMLGLVFINGYFLLIGILFLSNVAIYELNLALSKISFKLITIPAYLFNNIFILLTYYYRDKYLLPLLSIYLLVLLIVLIFSDHLNINNIFSNIFISIYISLSYACFILIKDSNWLFYLFGIASITDTCAYLVGMGFGKNKLYEKLSPKKTIEGSIGGIVGAVLFAIVFEYFTDIKINYIIFIIMTILLSMISQIGDLIASYIKRKADIKDYGYIFKGHGGVMDRFDSVLLIAPIILQILKIFRS